MPQQKRAVGLDVAKNKVAACIRSVGRLSAASTPEGHAELVAWLRANRVGRAVMLKRLQFHHTPKHASWLNMVEIEISVLRSQCLDRRINDKDRLVAEIAAWERQRNANNAKSTGCSQPKRPAKTCEKPTPSMSHNLGAKVLVAPSTNC